MVSFSDVGPLAPLAPLSPSRPDMARNAATAPQVRRNGGWRALAGLSRFAGAVLMLAAVGIWMLSGPLWDAQMMLMRLGVSVAFMCLGLVLLHAGSRRTRDEIQLDLKAGQLRHLRRGRDGIARTCRTVELSSVAEVRVADDHLALRDRNGALVLELTGLAQDQILAIRRQLAQV